MLRGCAGVRGGTADVEAAGRRVWGRLGTDGLGEVSSVGGRPRCHSATAGPGTRGTGKLAGGWNTIMPFA